MECVLHSQVRHHRARAELGVPGDSKGSLKQRALDGRMIIEIVRLCDRPLPSIVPRLDHGTQRDSMMLLLRVAAPPPRIYVHTACERDLAFARGGGGGGVSRFNLPLVNGREGGREKGAGAFEPPRGYENHGVEEHFFAPPLPLSPPPLPSSSSRARRKRVQLAQCRIVVSFGRGEGLRSKE